jgi:uncharacterized protein DUF4911
MSTERIPSPAKSQHDRFDPPTVMQTLWLAMPREHIAEFKALVESYDNLATLRTEIPRLHHLRLYFAPESAAEVEALIDSLTDRFAIRRLRPPDEA